VRLDAEQVRGLYASMITVRRRPDAERRALLDEIQGRALRDFGVSSSARV